MILTVLLTLEQPKLSPRYKKVLNQVCFEAINHRYDSLSIHKSVRGGGILMCMLAKILGTE